MRCSILISGLMLHENGRQSIWSTLSLTFLCSIVSAYVNSRNYTPVTPQLTALEPYRMGVPAGDREARTPVRQDRLT